MIRTNNVHFELEPAVIRANSHSQGTQTTPERPQQTKKARLRTPREALG